MTRIHIVPPEVVEANWARYRAKQPRPRVTAPKLLNVQQVLDLGNLVFFTFRGRAYGVPPLPYKAGLRFADVSADLKRLQGELIQGQLTRDAIAEYRQILAALPGLMWRHARPVGRARRLLRVVGLLRNPFEEASEKEFGELLDFFLSRRMTSSVQFPTSRGPSLSPPRRTA